MTVVGETIRGMDQKIKVRMNIISANSNRFSFFLVVTIQGPIFRPTEYTISMRDLFAPWIPW